MPQLRCDLLREHDDDSAGAPDVRELVDALVVRDAAEGMTTVARRDPYGSVDVVDCERDAVHPDGVRLRRLRLDGRGVMYSNSSRQR